MSSCFKIISKNTRESCFLIDSIRGEGCFSVSVDEASDNVLPESAPDEIEIEGFTYIKSLHAHGLFRLLVLGKYKPTVDAEELEVLAAVQYIPSVSGGIGEVKGVTDFILLSSMSISLGGVLMLGGYDNRSSLSKIHLVLGSRDVIWLHPVSLLPTEDTRRHNKPSKGSPASYPYLTEDTYGYLYYENNYAYPMTYADGKIDSIYSGTPVFWRQEEKDCSFISSCGGGEYRTCAVNRGHAIFGNGEYSYLKACSHVDGQVIKTEIGATLAEMCDEPHLISEYCTKEGSFSKSQRYIQTLRNGVVVTTTGHVYFKSIEKQSHTEGRTLQEVYNSSGNPPYYEYRVSWDINAGIFLGKAVAKIQGLRLNEGMNITMDKKYFIAQNHNGSWACTIDGKKTGNISAHFTSRSTLINGVILHPFQGKIKQTPLKKII